MTRELANGIKKIFFVVITLLSLSTSFLYFVEVFSFGRGLITDTIVAVIINGSIGVIVLDGAAIAWLKIYLGASDNNTVRTMAAVGMTIGVIGSAVSSFAYLLISANDYVVAPDVQLYTQVTMAIIIIAHFLLVFGSGFKSTQAKIDERSAAMISDATDEMLKLTESKFREAIPMLAEMNAAQLVNRLRGQFAQLSMPTGEEVAQPSAPPQPHKNYFVVDPLSNRQRGWHTLTDAITDARRVAHKNQCDVMIVDADGQTVDIIAHGYDPDNETLRTSRHDTHPPTRNGTPRPL